MTAKTADQLRQTQAVLLPLEFGLSLEQTAKAIGVSVGWTCQLRHLESSLRAMELDHPRARSIVAWPWIINSPKN